MKALLVAALLVLAGCGDKKSPDAETAILVQSAAMCDGKPCVEIKGKLKPGAKVSAEQANMMLKFAISGSK